MDTVSIALAINTDAYCSCNMFNTYMLHVSFLIAGQIIIMIMPGISFLLDAFTHACNCDGIIRIT